MTKKPYRDNYAYSKANFRHYHLKVANRFTEIVETLNAQDNINAYIIMCIQEHLEREKENGGTDKV